LKECLNIVIFSPEVENNIGQRKKIKNENQIIKRVKREEDRRAELDDDRRNDKRSDDDQPDDDEP
jgi:hypothetical protein